MKNQNEKKYKISFCTVCMSRLHHLSQTLPKNIEDNLSYGNIEFVVLNYNSQDEMHNWILTEMADYLKKGVLKYFRTTEPTYFLRSHSKNIAARMASGDIVCNIDADNFIGKGFAAYVNQEFLKYKNCYLMVQKTFKSKDCYGRICVLKKDFLDITGYDERMMDYGFEDDDLINRLNLFGKKASYITKERYLNVLEHNDNARIANEKNFNEIHHIYYRHINHFSSELIYLFKNGTFLKGILIINRLINSTSISNIFEHDGKREYAYSIQDDSWSKGRISDYENFSHGFEIFDDKHFEEMVMFLSQISNRLIMLKNKHERKIKVNKFFGEAVFHEDKTQSIGKEKF